MMLRGRLLLIGTIVAGLGAAFGLGVYCGGPPAPKAAANASDEPEIKLSEIDVPDDLLGADWRLTHGLVIDSWDEIENLPASRRRHARSVRQNTANIGLAAAADFTLVKTRAPANTVTVRVLRFRDAAACQAWLEEFRRLNPDRLIEVPCDTCKVFDLRGMHKRYVIAGELSVSSHQLRENDDHLKALQTVTAQLGIELR